MKKAVDCSRRNFLKTFLILEAFALGSTTGRQILLAETRRVRSRNGTMVISLSDFPSLQSEFGSVRIGTSGLRNNVPEGLFYPLLINRGPENQFYALNSECSHAGCVVRAYTRAANACVCPCHGSRYAIDGRRVSGPASFDLLSYPVTFDGSNTLRVELPDFPLFVSVLRAQAPDARVCLEFHAFAKLEYEVAFRESWAAPWDPVSFSITPDGPADQTVLIGDDLGVNVYVDSGLQTGFYAVRMRIRSV
jgi:Rieske Fe-S protein